MKRIQLLPSKTKYLALVLIALLFSCEQITDSITIDIPIKPEPIVFQLEIPTLKTSSKNDITLFSATIDLGVGSILANNNYPLDRLQALSLKEMEIEAIAPDNSDLSHLIGLKFYLGKEDKLLAEATSVSNDKRTLYFTISQNNLVQYAQEDALPISIKAKSEMLTNFPEYYPGMTLSLQLELVAKVKVS